MTSRRDIYNDGPQGLRLGVLALVDDQIIERDLKTLLPHDVLTFTTRIAFDGICTLDELAKMSGKITDTARLLNTEMALDAVIFGCTSGTIAIGPEKIHQAIKQIHPKATIINPVDAAARALEHLAASRINIITPYEQGIASAIRADFEERGFTINHSFDFDITASVDISRVRPDAITGAALELGSNGADAVFISCTDFQSLMAIDDIESGINLPVVTSNQAMIWNFLDAFGLGIDAGQYGRLLQPCMKQEARHA